MVGLKIVDGSQRLRTIQEYLLGGFKLDELDQLTHVSGLKFSDLPQSRQRKIRNRSIRGIVLNEHADEAARLDMFDRINTGSKMANRAEVRREPWTVPSLSSLLSWQRIPCLRDWRRCRTNLAESVATKR